MCSCLLPLGSVHRLPILGCALLLGFTCPFCLIAPLLGLFGLFGLLGLVGLFGLGNAIGCGVASRALACASAARTPRHEDRRESHNHRLLY